MEQLVTACLALGVFDKKFIRSKTKTQNKTTTNTNTITKTKTQNKTKQNHKNKNKERVAPALYSDTQVMAGSSSSPANLSPVKPAPPAPGGATGLKAVAPGLQAAAPDKIANDCINTLDRRLHV